MTMLLTLLLLLAAPPQAPLDVRADHMTFDQASGRVVFKGEVQAKQGQLVLRCAVLTAKMGDAGLTGIVAEQITLSTGPWSATAARARYDDAKGTVTLSGDPVVRRGKDVLRGDRVIIWTDTGRLVVERPRGTMQAPQLDALGKALPK
jgi:lipopolysaccharide transport protein LptA